MSEKTNMPEQKVILDYLKDFDKFSLGLYSKLKKDNENVIEVKENEYNIDVENSKYSVKNIIKFPYRGNIKDLFDYEFNGDDPIKIISDITIFRERNSKIDTDKIYLNDLVHIGNNKVFFTPTKKELYPDSLEEEHLEFFEMYYINFNERTGDLIVDCHKRYKKIAEKCLGFFLDIDVADNKEKRESEYYDSFKTDVNESYKRIAFTNVSMLEDDFNTLNNDESKSILLNKIISKLPTLYGYNKRAFFDFLSSKNIISINLISNESSEVKPENIIDFVDNTSLLLTFYSNGLDSISHNYDGEIEKDKRGVPVINEDDVKCLSFIGLTKENVKNLLEISTNITDISYSEMSSVENKLNDNNELKSKSFESSCELCTIINNEFTDSKADLENELIKYIVPINTLHDLEKRFDENKKAFDSQIEELVSLQITSRSQLKQQMENGTFKNYHYFTSAMLYFSTMKRNNIYGDECKDSGALNLFYRFILSKLSNIIKNDKDYFISRIMNTFKGQEDSSYLSSLRNFVSYTVLPVFSGRDCKDSTVFSALINETNSKDTLIESVSNYPLHQVMKADRNINKIFSFDESKNDEFEKEFEIVSEKNKELGFNANFDISEYSKDLYNKFICLKKLIDEKYDELISIFKTIYDVLIESIKSASSKKIKSIKKSSEVSSYFIAISSLTKYIEVITSKKIKELNENNEEVEREIDDNENKGIILKFILNLVSKEIVCGMYNRLYDSMEDVCDSIETKNKRDIGSYFTISTSFVILCADVLSSIKDNGTNENVESVFDKSKIDIVGKDAFDVLISGLVGKEDNGESKLNIARNELIKMSIDLSSVFTDISIDILNRLIKR